MVKIRNLILQKSYKLSLVVIKNQKEKKEGYKTSMKLIYNHFLFDNNNSKRIASKAKESFTKTLN